MLTGRPDLARQRIRARLILPEGMEAGLIAALAVIAVFLGRDMWIGEPIHTPSVLGTMLVNGLDAARTTRSAPGAAALYNIVHFGAWVALGTGFAFLMRRAENDPIHPASPSLSCPPMSRG